MDIKSIDWNEAWKKARTERSRKWKDAGFWNRRAPSFAKHASESPYATDFIRIMQPDPDWSVLDVGCGAGTLARPLARMVKQVTALDSSDVMLDILNEQCSKEGLTNINIMHTGWEDDWHNAGAIQHDVAVASRSLIVDDLKEALDKLNSFAKKKVFVSAIVGDGPFDRRLHEIIGRQLSSGPDYIYVYNLLHQMGIAASVSFVSNKEEKTYASCEEKLNSLRWMLEDMTLEEEERLRVYLNEKMVCENGRWKMPLNREVFWAVIWWDKK